MIHCDMHQSIWERQYTLWTMYSPYAAPSYRSRRWGVAPIDFRTTHILGQQDSVGTFLADFNATGFHAMCQWGWAFCGAVLAEEYIFQVGTTPQGWRYTESKQKRVYTCLGSSCSQSVLVHPSWANINRARNIYSGLPNNLVYALRSGRT